MTRPFFVMGGSFLLSVWFSSFVSVSVQVMIIVTGLLGFIISILFAPPAYRGIFSCVFLFAGFAAGLFCFQNVRDQQITDLIALDQPVQITAKIIEIEARSNHRYTYYLTVQTAQTLATEELPASPPMTQSFETILYSDVYLDAKFYDMITLPVIFYRPTSSQSFDSERYYRSRGVFLLAYFNGLESTLLESLPQKPLLYYLKTINIQLAREIDRAMPTEQATVLKSMVLGDRTSIDETLREQYINAGLIHLFSISGIHVSILAGFAGLFFQAICRKRQMNILLQMLVIIGFIALSGMRVSAVRAGIMLLIFLSGKLFLWQADGLNSLCLAGFLIVLFDPYAILDLGFLMSFTATLGILSCSDRLATWFCEKFYMLGELSRKIMSAVAVSITANLFLLPIYVIHYQVLSLVFVPANLATILTSAFIIVGGFILLFFLLLQMVIPFSSMLLAPLFFAQIQVITIQNNVAVWFGRLPFATFGLDDEILRITLSICLILLMGVLFFQRKHNIIRPTALLCVLVFLVGNSISTRALNGRIQIALIGDGETANLVIIDQRNAVVISPKDSNYIDQRTYRYLKGKGVRKIDALVLLYDDMALYKDTLHLVQNFPVVNILHNRENITISSILNSNCDNIIEIGHGGSIEINTSIQLDFSYYNNLIDTKISCYGIEMALTSYIPMLQDNAFAIALVRGNVSKPLVEIDSDYVVVMQRQWNPIIADNFYHNAADQQLELIITPDGVLREQNKLFLSAP